MPLYGVQRPIDQHGQPQFLRHFQRRAAVGLVALLGRAPLQQVKRQLHHLKLVLCPAHFPRQLRQPRQRGVFVAVGRAGQGVGTHTVPADAAVGHFLLQMGKGQRQPPLVFGAGLGRFDVHLLGMAQVILGVVEQEDIQLRQTQSAQRTGQLVGQKIGVEAML